MALGFFLVKTSFFSFIVPHGYSIPVMILSKAKIMQTDSFSDLERLIEILVEALLVLLLLVEGTGPTIEVPDTEGQIWSVTYPD